MGQTREDLDFHQAVTAAYPRLLRYARVLTRNVADAEDLVHETIERGLACRASFLRDSAADRWLSTIMRRLFIDRYRHARVEERAERPGIDREAAVEPGRCRIDDGDSSIELWELFTIEDVRRASALLRPCLRSTYVMFTFERRSYAEIASMLSISDRTVASRVFRARLHLRKLLLSGSVASSTTRNDIHADHSAEMSPRPSLQWTEGALSRAAGRSDFASQTAE